MYKISDVWLSWGGSMGYLSCIGFLAFSGGFLQLANRSQLMSPPPADLVVQMCRGERLKGVTLVRFGRRTPTIGPLVGQKLRVFLVSCI